MDIFNDLMDLYPFLKNLDSATKDIIRNSLAIKNFESEATLMKEGSSCPGFSLIVSGSIRVYKLSPKGKEVTLYKLEGGDTCYLSMSCILANNPYPAFAEVLSPTIIAFIPTNVFNEYIYNNIDFQKYIFNNLYLKFNNVLSTLEEIAFERVDVRIAKFLLTMSNRSNNSKFLYLTQEKIAQELGTSREVVSRILTDFKNKDILISQRGKITILDFEKLNLILNT